MMSRSICTLSVLLSVFLALPVSRSALAQQAQPADASAASAADEPGLQEVTVSASAIKFSGYDQPTPVTTLGLDELQSAAHADLTDAVRVLPAFGGSSSPQNSNQSNNISNGNAGLDQLNLRSLAPKRTLVLIDGQRVVDGTTAGGAETSNIPSTLVQRVDVVTGGASAIWGSSAVAGVVNYILNHNFNGVQVNIQDSNNEHNEHATYGGDITAGTGFMDNRGHIEASLSYQRSPDTFYAYQAEGYQFQNLVNNPACVGATSGTPNALVGGFCPSGQPWFLHATNVGVSSATPGGLVGGCLNGAGAKIANCSLINTYFVGPNATPLQFNPGINSANFSTAGGTPNTINSTGEIQGVPQTTQTAFVLGSFNITDHIRASLQLNYGYTSFYENSYNNIQYGNRNAATIYTGNPFIPASIQAQMTALGISALQVGTMNTNPFTGPAPDVKSQIDTVGEIVLFESRRLGRGVFSLEGDLGSDWAWNAYAERSETHQYETGLNNNLNSALLNAENAVTVGTYTPTYTANLYPNPTGIPNGRITCASNLLPTAAKGYTTNCSPLNIFGSGPGVASEEAIAYVNGVARAGGEQTHTNLFENVASLGISGKLPFGLPAGRVAVAAGAVYRYESGQLFNCGVNCTNVNFPYGNFAALQGDYNVKEGSLEVNAPLLKDTLVKDLSIDAAYRGIDYSTSGFVSTYKFGLVSQLNDWVRARVSYSRDIRAGDIAELFASPQSVGASTRDPRTGSTVPYFSIAEGNSQLLPEDAETRTAGLVFTPIEGLTSSIDWYYIRIKDVITTGLSVAQVEQQCQAGVAAFCQSLIFGTYPNGCSGPTLNSCAAGLPLVAVVRQAVNASALATSGLDMLANYRRPFLGGYLNINADFNYTFMLRYTTVVGTCDPDNGLSRDENIYCGVPGNPKLRGTVGVSYAQDGWLGTVQLREIGKAHLASNWDTGVQVDNNDIPAITYMDLRLSYKWDNGIQLYGAVDNALDKQMPFFSYSAYSGGTLYEPPFRDDVYDGYGRVWRVGIRAKF